MNQCVPSWGLNDNPNNPKLPNPTHTNSLSSAHNVPILDYEVAELTWENGQLSMHGLGQPRVPNKLQSTASTAKYTWEKPRAGETLEAIVNQAAFPPPYKINDFGSYGGDELVPWFDNHHHHHRSDSTTAAVPISISASATMTMDALVPCANAHDDDGPRLVDGCSTGVGSCPGNDNSKFERQRVAARVETGAAHEWSCRDHSVSGSATFGRDLSVRGLTSTSTGSPGNTSSGKNGGKSTTGDEHDSVYSHSRPQRDADDEEENKKKGKGKGKSSISTKRSRAAAIHNQSERKRRDKINQRMKTLQKMVPNSSKTDKASMLDEVIEYLKQLQAQVHVMSRVSPAMMMPLAMQQQLQMSMMNPMTMGMGMGMGMGMNVMDLNSLAAAGRTNIHGMPPVFHPSAFMPLGPWDGNGVVGDRIPPPTSLMPDPMSAFLACQQPQSMMTMDAYSRMAAMFQQMHQQSQGHCSNKNQ